MKRRLCNPRAGDRGVVLVVALSMIVLVTVVVVAFFARTQINQQIESGTSGRESAETLALGALEAVTADLMSEIRASSTNTQAPFRPVTNSAVAPFRATQTDVPASSSVLVKQSTPASPMFPSSAPYNATPVNRLIPAASPVSTTAAALEGRVITTNRWNSIRLLTQPPQAAAQLPNWIYVARAGFASPQQLSPEWSEPSSANSNYIVGRVAFNIYDVSGLLNANAAGYPSSLAATAVGAIKGLLAGADLTALPGVAASAVDELIAFRAPSVSDYAQFVRETGVRSGYANHVMRSPAGTELTNAFFVTRQDLIRYATRKNPGLQPALPFLVHLRRSLNAPSTRPPYDASTRAGGSGDAEFQYRTRGSDPAARNRDVLSVRVAREGEMTGYGIDGTPFRYRVSEGDPLIARRFPLQKLAWIGPSGPEGVSAEAVQHSFGLRWDGSRGFWQYVGPTGASPRDVIATLQQVAQESREPNLFELLQAGILEGSVGVRYGNPQLGEPAWQDNIALQILRIGACMIDQADSDSFPTVIEFSSPGGVPFWRAVGVEDLPYIETVQTLVGDKPGSSSLVPYVACRLFNPHRAPAVAGTRAPRIRMSFAGGMRFRSWWGTYPNASNDPKIPQMIISVPFAAPLASPTMDGSAAANSFRVARLPNGGDFSGGIPDTIGASPAAPTWSQLPSVFGGAGLRMPDFQQDLAKVGPSANSESNQRNFLVYYGYRSGAGPTDYGNFFIEFETPDGKWLPYSFWAGINDQVTWASTTAYFTSTVCQLPSTNAPTYVYKGIPFEREQLARHVIAIRSDPRSFRINSFFLNAAPDMDLEPTMPSLWSDVAPGTTQGSGYGGRDTQQKPTPPGVPANPPGQRAPLRQTYTGDRAGYYYPGWLSRNFQASPATRISAYEDADSVRRLADSGRYGNTKAGNVAPSTGNPYMREEDRPVMLNRPFRSAAELGYVFRDLPWKSLDFFSQNSADTALLDMFSLTDPVEPLVEDRLNIQAAPEEVLRALLAGTPLDAVGTGPVLGTTESNALAKGVRDAGPMLATTQDLVLSALGPLSGDYTNPSGATVLADTAFGTTDNALIKSRREAVTRALGPVSDDRTWLLAVDLIAQAGRFPPGTTDAARFSVAGERRYWLHLAIDRYTAKIVHRSVEAVYE